ADYDAVNGKLDIALNTISAHTTANAEKIVDAAISEGKIAPSSKSYHLAACAQKDGIAAFQTMVKASPKLPAVGDSPTPGQLDKGNDVAINSQQTKLLVDLGIDPADEKILAEISAT
ncbi:MAG: hypothetical protein JKY49_07510, partial [Cohaesibacteraceae bacterium]|nr:hypothetical protein [Cohaesibacteraceae bacterium]MBL4876693.1 hypothetical protein [Cohaesibacteraceae bacterium]